MKAQYDPRADKLLQGFKFLSKVTERVSVSMYAVLYEVYKEPGNNHSFYAEKTNFTLANINRHVANLTQLNFLTSTEGDQKSHGRAKFLNLTKEGQEFCENTLNLFYND